MPSIAYYNGSFLHLSDIKIPLSDRSVFFGDAIYDAAIGRGGRIYLEKAHSERFFSSAALAGIAFSKSESELSEILHTAVALSEYEEYFVYFQLSANGKERKHAREANFGHNLLVTVTPFSIPPTEKQLSLILFPDKRYGYCNIKTTNLLPAVFASNAAMSAGADEAVFVNSSSITECAHSNIFILKDGRLITHPDGEHILSGISRKRLMEISEKLGIKTILRPFSKEELFSCDEALVTSTTKLCLSASRLDGLPIGGRDRKTAHRLISAMRYDYFRQTSKFF